MLYPRLIQTPIHGLMFSYLVYVVFLNDVIKQRVEVIEQIDHLQVTGHVVHPGFMPIHTIPYAYSAINVHKRRVAMVYTLSLIWY